MGINKWISEGLNLMISIPLGVVSWSIALFSLDLNWFISLLMLVGVPVVFYSGFKGLYIYQFLKRNGLSYNDYKFIDSQINVAEKKVKKLNLQLLKMKHLSSIKFRLDFIQANRKLLNEIKKDPKKYFQAEKFFYQYLDSALELSSRYNLLTKHPLKTWEYDDTLHTTRKTLFDLKPLIDEQIHAVLNNNLENLQLEIDLANLVIDEHKNSKK